MPSPRSTSAAVVVLGNIAVTRGCVVSRSVDAGRSCATCGISCPELNPTQHSWLPSLPDCRSVVADSIHIRCEVFGKGGSADSAPLLQ